MVHDGNEGSLNQCQTSKPLTPPPSPSHASTGSIIARSNFNQKHAVHELINRELKSAQKSALNYYMPPFHTPYLSGIRNTQSNQRSPAPSPGSSDHARQETQSIAQKFLSRYTLDPGFLENYEIEYELGQGGFGFVLGGRRRSDGTAVAIKFILKNKVPATGWARHSDFGIVPLEVYILSHCSHPNIISFLDYYDRDPFAYLVMDLHGSHWNSLKGKEGLVTKSDTATTDNMSLSKLSLRDTLSSSQSSLLSKSPPSLVHTPAQKEPTKPCPLTRCKTFPLPAKLLRRPSMDLFECIEEHDKLTEKEAVHVFKQIVEAVKYLHDRGIIHRDIKDEVFVENSSKKNIVIDDHMNVKLIDFGSASVEDKSRPYFDKFQGTLQYCPPEVLRGEKYKGRPADVWSLGILLYTILCGEVPFASSDQARRLGYRHPCVDLSPGARDLLDSLLQKSPCLRPTAEEILSHQWMNANRSSNDGQGV